MKKNDLIRVVGLIVIVIITISASTEIKQSLVCGPLHFAGITLGVTTDSEVKRLLGNGLYVKQEGDTGGRYFINPKGTATLHVVNFTDTIVGEVTVQEGVTIAKGQAKTAISRWFNPKEGFGNGHSIHLGSTKDEVKKNLGDPSVESSLDEWKYYSSCACETDTFFTVHFRNNQIWKVVFSAPAG